MSQFLNDKPNVNHLYADLAPKDRIARLLQEFLGDDLTRQGFAFSKSKKQFVKKDDFFEHHISYYLRKFNNGNNIVQFDIILSVHSPKYRNWEKDFYGLTDKDPNSIDGNRVGYIENWAKEFYPSMWYDLVGFDNDKVMTSIAENLKNAGKKYFDNFTDFDSAISYLSKNHVVNFETIIDFYIIQNKYKEAVEFFDSHNQWHEERLHSDKFDYHDQFVMNREKPYLLRKDKLRIT